MKRKKQTRKIKQWLVAALGLTLLGTGLWAGMNGEKLQAKPKSDINFSPKGVEDTEPWLPYYKPGLGIGRGGWLDATTSYIPKENAVGFKYYAGGKDGAIKTQIIGWSDGIGITKEEDGTLKYEYGFGWEPNAENPIGLAYNNYVQMDLMKGKQWIAFNKVGFYEGLPIAALVKITPPPHLELDYDDEDGNKYFKKMSSVGIGLNSEKVAGVYTAKYDSLFSVIMGPGVEYVDVSVEFFRYNGKNLILIDGEFPYISEDKISLSPYWTFDKLRLDKYLTFNQEDINNIYSVSHDFTPLEDATILSYRIPDLNPNKVEITPIALNDDIQGQLNHLFTYIPKKDQLMEYHLSVNPTTLAFKTSNGSYYNVNTPVKIEFPDPQASTIVYTEIVSNGKGLTGMEGNQYIQDFGYQFIQSVPWEAAEGYYAGTTINNRTQYPSWTIDSGELSGTVYPEAGSWKIEAKDDLNLATEELFATEENKETGTITIKPYDTELKQVNGKDVIEGKVITGTDEETEFYNHYYKFQKNVLIDYKKPISKSAIDEKDGKPLGIFDFSGKVSLNVVDVDQTEEQKAMNQNRPNVTYKTEINFLADDVQYKYLDKTIYDAQITAGKTESEARAAAAINFGGLTWDETPQPSGEGQAIVTWQVPLTPTTYTAANLADPGTPESETNKAPTIPGYEYVAGSAKLNEQTDDYQIKVTKLLADGKTEAEATAADYTKSNEVVLFYEPKGDVEIEAEEEEDEEGVVTYRADDIDFGNITVPATSTITKQPEKVNGADKDQYPSLVVKDTRLKNYREAGWTLYVTMTETFRLKEEDGTFDDAVTVDNILKYKNNFSFVKDGTAESPAPIAITKGDKIPIESLIPTETQLDETIWRTKVELGADKENNGEASKGFYLEINKPTQLGITAGKYEAALTFSVENSAFTTSPGRSK